MLGQRHVSPLVQLPPLPHVCEQTVVVQFGSNQPGLQAHVSGAMQKPPCWHCCTHSGSSHTPAALFL
jgi:hypothetical protein